jgi:general secretion pathway protein E
VNMLIGELLSSIYGVPKEEIERGLQVQQKVGGYLGQILMQTGAITETQLVQALSEQLGVPVFNKDEHRVEVEKVTAFLFDRVEMDLLAKNSVIPIDVDPDKHLLFVVSNDPLGDCLGPYLVQRTGCNIVYFLATEQAVKELSGIYGNGKKADFISLHGDDSPEKLKEMAFEAPVIKFLNNLLSRAVEVRATDIHIEPADTTYRVRFRVDGLLHDMEYLDETFYLATVSRIKLLSGLDIAEKRLPQDGKLSTRVASTFLDIRVSTLPTVRGEGIVLRLLYRENLSFDIVSLGLEEDHARLIIDLISKPYGLLLVTGPTGSGKTTSLYSMLSRLNDKERKIITVEDPVEYQIGGMNQIQVKSEIGFTFASALRSILRHDPDIIMIGEIRDRETAEIAVQSALTGHLVLSTLHTNDAPSSLFRLIEMGIEDYLLNSAIIGVIAQRIVRNTCPFCGEEVVLDEGVMTQFKMQHLREEYRRLIGPESRFIKGRGCDKCVGTGYRGRSGIFECFAYADDMKECFLKTHSPEALHGVLDRSHAFRTLRTDGLIKVLKGVTTLEEVLRIS